MLASLARAYWSVATTPLKAVTTVTAIITSQTQPPKTLTGTKRPAGPNTLGGLALVDGVDGDCNVAVLDVDVPLHRYEKNTKMRRRERTAKYG